MVINSRPLTFVSSDDLEEPLIPSHLLFSRRMMDSSRLSTYDSSEVDETFDVQPVALTQRAKHLNRTIDKFWDRWKEYLVELREAHRQCAKKSGAPAIAQGDAVIIHEYSQP